MSLYGSEQWQQERHTLEVLSSLSYRTGELSSYLHEIAQGICQLIKLDWSVVTICGDGLERILASTIDLGESGNQVYSLHNTLTGTVIATGSPLIVEDATTCTDYGKCPEGYRAYLGVPLRKPNGEVIGTICSFQQQPRHFSTEEVRLAEIFAERAATAIDNYQLYQQQQEFNKALEIEVAKGTEELRVALAKLVEKERLAAIGEFTAMIVHEVRNPLTTIMMGLNYFKRTQLSESAQTRLMLSLSEASRLESLLSQILLYAKPQTLQPSELDLNALLQELLIPLREMPEAQGREIVFTPTQTTVKILADKDKLKQVLINIVRNACEAVPEGAVIQWTVEDSAVLGTVCIRVQNGGPPIPPEVQEMLTEPFYSTKPSGTGLGLAIVKRIVEAHNGELCIESTELLGTIVSIQLPLS